LLICSNCIDKLIGSDHKCTKCTQLGKFVKMNKILKEDLKKHRFKCNGCTKTFLYNEAEDHLKA
jgi:transposase-like protein